MQFDITVQVNKSKISHKFMRICIALRWWSTTGIHGPKMGGETTCSVMTLFDKNGSFQYLYPLEKYYGKVGKSWDNLISFGL